MESGTHKSKIIIKKLSKAIIYFVVIALAIPLIVGSVTGTSIASLLTLITSTFVLQAGAPLLGVGLGISNPVIIITMFCFALGMVLAVFEVCDSLSETSERVQKWLEKMEKASAKYPQLQKYGVISCFFIAWIPPFGIYGAPVFAWLMNWKRWHAIPIIVASFTVASLFVLFFANKITEIMLLAANLGAMIFIIVSMVTLGLSTTVSQVIAPLKDKNLMSRAILANFILVPVLAYLLVTGLHLPAGIAIGLILVGTAAGSPFLARANQIPADKRELAGGLGVLLTIFSVFYIPIIAPFLIPGESKIDPVFLFITVCNYYHYPAFYCDVPSIRERRKGGTGTSLAGQDIVWCILCDFYRRNICVCHPADHNYRLWGCARDNPLCPCCIWYRASAGRICTTHATSFVIRDCPAGSFRGIGISPSQPSGI